MARILIVEDEKKIARFLELELVHEGYEVLTAFDGRSGLETAQEQDPDLLILDLMLPELSGIEVCRRLRHTSDVPIIMLTAKDDVSDKVMGLDMGADDYVTKPFVASPTATAVTTPLATVATDSFELVQTTAALSASSGATVAVSVAVSPAVMVSSVLSSSTPVTGVMTVTAQEAVNSPSSVLAVIIAIPEATAVTMPSATVATASLELVQVTFLFSAASGITVAVSVKV